MGVCLCISVFRWGCLCCVPSSISRLPFSDGHWSSISTHIPDWCCTILCRRARIVILKQRHAYYDTFSPQNRGKLLCWYCEAQICIDGELSKCVELFAFQEFVCKCTTSPSKNNVCLKQGSLDNRVFVEWIWKIRSFMRNSSEPWLTDCTSSPDSDDSEPLSAFIWAGVSVEMLQTCLIWKELSGCWGGRDSQGPLLLWFHLRAIWGNIKESDFWKNFFSDKMKSGNLKGSWSNRIGFSTFVLNTFERVKMT